MLNSIPKNDALELAILKIVGSLRAGHLTEREAASIIRKRAGSQLLSDFRFSQGRCVADRN